MRFLYLLLILILNSCASNTSQYLHLSWQSNVYKSDNNFAPVKSNDYLFVADSHSYLYRYNFYSGKLISKVRLHDHMLSGIAVGIDSIFYINNKGELISLSKNDYKLQWKTQLYAFTNEIPIIVADKVLVKLNNGIILAYSINKGHLIWVYTPSMISFFARNEHNTFYPYDYSVILNGDSTGSIELLNINNGNLLWKTKVANPGLSLSEQLIGINSNPILDGKIVYVAVYNLNIVAIDIYKGIKWVHNIATQYPISFDISHIYVLDDKGVLYALNKSDGSIVWTNDILKGRLLQSPILLNNMLLLVDNYGYIYLFNCNNGELLQKMLTHLSNISGISVTGNDLVLQSSNGYLLKVEVASE